VLQLLASDGSRSARQVPGGEPSGAMAFDAGEEDRGRKQRHRERRDQSDCEGTGRGLKSQSDERRGAGSEKPGAHQKPGKSTGEDRLQEGTHFSARAGEQLDQAAAGRADGELAPPPGRRRSRRRHRTGRGRTRSSARRQAQSGVRHTAGSAWPRNYLRAKSDVERCRTPRQRRHLRYACRRLRSPAGVTAVARAHLVSAPHEPGGTHSCLARDPQPFWSIDSHFQMQGRSSLFRFTKRLFVGRF
jgi:hypothetical protein